MASFDFKSGYHHIEIHPDFQQFLGFSWEINGKQAYFVFTVLPFGLNSGLILFHKVFSTVN